MSEVKGFNPNKHILTEAAWQRADPSNWRPIGVFDSRPNLDEVEMFLNSADYTFGKFVLLRQIDLFTWATVERYYWSGRETEILPALPAEGADITLTFLGRAP